MEFVSRAVRAPQSKTAQAQNALQMREQHLHLLSQPAGDRVLGGPGDRTCPVPGWFEDRPEDLARGLLRAAACLQRAGIAIGLAGPVAEHAVLVSFFLAGLREGPAALLQLFTAWTSVDIGLGFILRGKRDDVRGQHGFIGPAARHLPLCRAMLAKYATGGALRDGELLPDMLDTCSATGGAQMGYSGRVTPTDRRQDGLDLQSGANTCHSSTSSASISP